MNIKVIGSKQNQQMMHTYYLLDRYEEKKKLTAMARTSVYTASIILQLLIEGVIQEKGVVPPEKLGMNEVIFNRIMREL